MQIDGRVMDRSAEEGVRAVALGLLAEAAAAAKELAAGEGDEALHDFRVSLRRLRSALRAFRPWLETTVRPRHERRLKRIARSTNEARDAEVQLAWLAGQREALSSPRNRAGLELLTSRLEERARRGGKDARAAERLGAFADKLSRRLQTHARRVDGGAGAGARFGDVLAALVEDRVRALVASVDAVAGPLDEEAVHRARIEAKRLRYLLEPLGGRARADARAAAERLKHLQGALGSLHDLHVLSAELRRSLVDVAAQGAREAHAFVYARGATDKKVRGLRRGGARAGLVAILRLVSARRDALHAELERAWRKAGLKAVAGDARAVAAALRGRPSPRRERVFR